MLRMRRWLLVLMLVLLPLRGWVGEAMAGDMLQQHAARMAAHALASEHRHDHTQAHGEHRGHAAHDCLEHASPADGPQDPGEPQAGTDCPTCASCQACSSVALSPFVFVPKVVGFPHPLPEAVQRDYSSAEPALAFKPPRT